MGKKELEKTIQPKKSNKTSENTVSKTSSIKSSPKKTSLSIAKNTKTSSKSNKSNTMTDEPENINVSIKSAANSRKNTTPRVVHQVEVIDFDEEKNAQKTPPKAPKTKNSKTTTSSPQLPVFAERSKQRPKKIIIDASPQQKTVLNNRTTPTNNPQTKTTVKNNTEVTNDQNMKLPLIRRIHIQARYIVLGIFLILIAAFITRVAIWEHNYILAMEGSERKTTASSTTVEGGDVYEGGQEVDNTKPTETEIIEYHVAADKPRYLTIRSIGVYNARVVEIGLKNNGEIGTPYNIYDVGWYVNSALPGSDGVSLIDAHGGDLGYGIFRNLPKINIGDQIIIEMGDEVTKYTYVVADISFQDLGDAANAYMSTALSSPEPGVPSLTLITCTGEWWEQSQTYSQRLFVRAVLQE